MVLHTVMIDMDEGPALISCGGARLPIKVRTGCRRCARWTCRSRRAGTRRCRRTAPILSSMSFRRSRLRRCSLYFAVWRRRSVRAREPTERGACDREAVRGRIDDLQHERRRWPGMDAVVEEPRRAIVIVLDIDGEADRWSGVAAAVRVVAAWRASCSVEFQRTRFSKQIVVTDVRR